MAPRVLGVGPSCNECRRRKIKCDRLIPCSYCTRTKIECIYPQSAFETGGYDGIIDRIESVENRLNSVENGISDIKQLLQLLLKSRNDEKCTVQSATSSATNDVPAISFSKAKDQMIGIEMSEGLGIESIDRRQPAFHSGDPLPSVGLVHPTPAQVIVIWQRFMDTVDPLLKIFHIPFLQRKVVNAIRALDRVEPYTECQMFAVYYCTIVEMSPDDCQNILGEKKEALLERYRNGVETALARLDFLNSPSISSLQAFVLYLSCSSRDEKGPNAHTLIGVAIRNAIRLKLHHHGTALSHSPFDAEMRRRLWWHICVMDVCMAAEHGTEPITLEKSFNTPFPSNLNDSMLEPDGKELPNSLTGKSEILFTLLRFEISYFARQIIFSEKFCRDNSYAILSTAEKFHAIDAFRSRIETQYLTYFNTITVFDDKVVIAARTIFDTIKRVSGDMSNALQPIGVKLDLREVFCDIRYRGE